MADITLVHDVDILRRDAATPITMGGDFRDTYIENESVDLNHGADIAFTVGISNAKIAPYHKRPLIYWDLTKFLPADAAIVSAIWHIYIQSSTELEAANYWIHRVRRTDWVEDEATWNIYKTGSNWGIAGCAHTDTDVDNVNPTPLQLGNLLGYLAWETIDLTTFAADAWANRGGILTFRFGRFDVGTADGFLVISAKERDNEYVHHLRVTYTLSGKTFEAFVF